MQEFENFLLIKVSYRETIKYCFTIKKLLLVNDYKTLIISKIKKADPFLRAGLRRTTKIYHPAIAGWYI